MRQYFLFFIIVILLAGCSHRKIVITEPAAVQKNPVLAASGSR